MRYSKEEKGMWLEDWRQSGKSAYKYARDNGIVPWTFTRWIKEETETKQCFVEVPTITNQALIQQLEILIEKGEVKIHIPLGIDHDQLQIVMERLGAAL